MFTFNQNFTIGLVGFGAFGRLVATHLAPFAPIQFYDPAFNGTMAVLPNGTQAQYANLPEIAQCDYVILAIPADRIGATCRVLAPHLRPGTIVMDVGSVKQAPIDAMRSELPDHVNIVGTHPMFGPQSAAQGLAGKQIAICPGDGQHHRLVAAFLKRRLRLTPIFLSAADHDKDAAIVQGLTHLIAGILIKMDLPTPRVTTASFDLVAQAVDLVRNDAECVQTAIHHGNAYSAEMREIFFETARNMRRQMWPTD